MAESHSFESDEISGEGVESQMTQIIDPYEPLAVNAGKIQAGVNRLNQRERRARILASTRKLIGERGSGDITVREIALISDVSPQTLYNLVGPRDQAIVDALNEYSDRPDRGACAKSQRAYRCLD